MTLLRLSHVFSFSFLCFPSFYIFFQLIVKLFLFRLLRFSGSFFDFLIWEKKDTTGGLVGTCWTDRLVSLGKLIRWTKSWWLPDAPLFLVVLLFLWNPYPPSKRKIVFLPTTPQLCKRRKADYATWTATCHAPHFFHIVTKKYESAMSFGFQRLFWTTVSLLCSITSFPGN